AVAVVVGAGVARVAHVVAVGVGLGRVGHGHAVVVEAPAALRAHDAGVTPAVAVGVGAVGARVAHAVAVGVELVDVLVDGAVVGVDGRGAALGERQAGVPVPVGVGVGAPVAQVARAVEIEVGLVGVGHEPAVVDVVGLAVVVVV